MIKNDLNMVIKKRLTTKEICQIYGVTSKTVGEWIKELKMPYVSFRGKNFFVESEVIEWEKKFKYNEIENNVAKHLV